MPRTLPAATLALSLAIKAERDGGQFLGMATPLAPTPEPVAMLKMGTREGLIWTVAARVSCVVGKAEVVRKRREMRVVVVRNCILSGRCGL